MRKVTVTEFNRGRASLPLMKEDWHTCLWTDCNKLVKKEHWGCFLHWKRIPEEFKEKARASGKPAEYLPVDLKNWIETQK